MTLRLDATSASQAAPTRQVAGATSPVPVAAFTDVLQSLLGPQGAAKADVLVSIADRYDMQRMNYLDRSRMLHELRQAGLISETALAVSTLHVLPPGLEKQASESLDSYRQRRADMIQAHPMYTQQMDYLGHLRWKSAIGAASEETEQVRAVCEALARIQHAQGKPVSISWDPASVTEVVDPTYRPEDWSREDATVTFSGEGADVEAVLEHYKTELKAILAWTFRVAGADDLDEDNDGTTDEQEEAAAEAAEAAEATEERQQTSPTAAGGPVPPPPPTAAATEADSTRRPAAIPVKKPKSKAPRPQLMKQSVGFVEVTRPKDDLYAISLAKVAEGLLGEDEEKGPHKGENPNKKRHDQLDEATKTTLAAKALADAAQVEASLKAPATMFRQKRDEHQAQVRAQDLDPTRWTRQQSLAEKQEAAARGERQAADVMAGQQQADAANLDRFLHGKQNWL